MNKIRTSNKYIFKNCINFIESNKLFLFFLFIFALKSILLTALVQTPSASFITVSGIKNSILNTFNYISFSLIILSIVFLFKGKQQPYVLLILNYIATLLIISDLCYFRGFSSYINFFLLDQLSMTEDLGGSIVVLFRIIDIIFIVDILVLTLLFKRYKKANYTKNRNYIAFLLIILCSSVYLGISYLNINLSDKAEPVFAQSALSDLRMPDDKMVSLGPIGYHFYDGYNYFENKRSYKLKDEDYKDIEKFYSIKEENLPDNKFKGAFKGKNLLLIQVESLENFVINKKVNNQEITPNINKLMNNSIYFENFHEQVWNGNSSDSDLLVNGSVYPVREGSTFYRYPNNTYPHSLPNTMEGLGYDSFVIHPDTAMYWNYKPALTALGYNNLYFQESLEVKEKIGLGISDEEYFKQAFDIIKKQKQPFLGMTVTITSHTPFEMPKEHQYLSLSEDINNAEIGKYFQAIHYTDKQIGMFIDKLDKEGLLENTVIAIYGDHTGVHKYFQDKINSMKYKESWWVDNENKIPLLIYSKDAKGETISVNGGPIDMVPTLGYLMGAEKSSYSTAMGRNLLNTKKDFVVLSNFQVKGTVTNEEKEYYKDLLILSDKVVRSNYFSKMLEEKNP